MAVSTKTRAKRHAHVKKTWEAGMPEFKILDYTSSLLKVLAHFSTNVDSKIKRQLACDYWKAEGKDVSIVSKMSEGWFHQAGPIAYLLTKDVPLEDRDIAWLNKQYITLVDYAAQKSSKEDDAEVKVSVKPNPQDLIRAKADLLGSEIDGIIDEVMKGKTDFNVKEFLKANEVSAPVSKHLASFYIPMLKEMDAASADNDYQLSEGYSHLGKRDFKRVHEFVRGVVSSCDTVALLARTTRKPRKRKEKPAGQMVSKVKYLKEYTDLKLKSVHPEKMVGSEEVWVFNVKYRKLFQYVAQDGMQISVKGTTLQNFDPEKSGAKTIRKPEVFFKGVDSMTKRPLVKSFKEIKGVLAKATGRINEDCVIVKVF